MNNISIEMVSQTIDVEMTPPGIYALSNHNHDERYYDKQGTDEMLSNKAAIQHSHADTDLNSFDLLNSMYVRPPFKRIVNRKNYSFINGIDSGWSNHYGKGTIAHDPIEKISGTGSMKIITTPVSEACGAKYTFTAQDWRNKTVKLWVKVDDWSKSGEVSILISTSGSFVSAFKRTLSSMMTTPSQYNNKWIELIIPQSKFTVHSGTPDWSTVNGIMVRAYGTTGNSVTAWFDEFATIDNPSKGIISITFDDGHVSQFTEAKTVLDKYGYKATNFVIPDYIGLPNYNSQNQIDIESQQGWDISGHHQTSLSTLTEEEIHNRLISVRQYLDVYGYKGSDLFAYPNGSENPTINKIVDRYFSIGRTIVDYPQAINYMDNKRINSRIVHNYDTVATVKSWVDQALAGNEWLILCFHKIIAPADDDIEYTPSDFTEVIDYIATKNVPVLPMSDALEFIKLKI